MLENETGGFEASANENLTDDLHQMHVASDAVQAWAPGSFQQLHFMLSRMRELLS
jgi:hypothetical protein